MAQDINRASTVIGTESSKVGVPSAGEHVVVAAQAAGDLALDFDPSQLADVSRSDNDLVFTFENGGTATISDFFTFAEQGEMSFTLPDGVSVAAKDILAAFDVDLPEPAAGPAAGPGAAGSGVGEYSADGGDLMGGVSRLGMTDPFFWGGGNARAEYPTLMLASLSASVGEEGGLLGLSSHQFNESGNGLFLSLTLSIPAPGEITVTIQLSGNANIWNLDPASEFGADYSLPGGTFPGGSYVYDAATNTIIVTLPTGSTGVTIPIETFDDHINERAEDLIFTIIETSGPVTGGVGESATVNFVEDGAVLDPADPLYGQLDGPVVGMISEVPADIYEGSANNSFWFGLTLTDPHSLDPYNGYNGNGLMSQDMQIVLNVGGSAASGGSGNEAGTDYHFEISQELWDLVQAGQVRFEPAVTEVDGKYVVTVSGDGQIVITLTGQVDADGNPGSLPAFELGNADLLGLTGVLHINGGEAGEEAENITVEIGSVTGNESQLGADVSIDVPVEADPVLSLSFAANSVQESGEGFNVTFAFDKDIADGVTFTAVIDLAGSSAELWNGDPDTEYKADYFLPGTFDASGNFQGTLIYDGSQIVGYSTTENGISYTYQDGKITVSGPSDSFDADNELEITFPLNDDHITESFNVNEEIQFAIEETTLDDGTYSGTVGSGQGGGIEIVEDRTDYTGNNGETDLKDGPLVTVSLQENTASSLYEGQPDGNGDPISSFYFQVNLQSPDGSGTYAGFINSDGSANPYLPQDMVITITVGGNAETGADYEFVPSAELQALIDAGTAGFTVNTDGTITVTLKGLLGTDGQPHADQSNSFKISDIEDLTFEAQIKDDRSVEDQAENITLAVTGTEGNESHFDPSLDPAEAEILPDASLTLSGGGAFNESQSNAIGGDAAKTIDVTLTLDKPLAYDLNVGINAGQPNGLLYVENYNGDNPFITADKSQADYALPTNLPTGVTWADPAFSVNGSGELVFNLVIDDNYSGDFTFSFVSIDDHRTEAAEFNIEFKIEDAAYVGNQSDRADIQVDGDASAAWIIDDDDNAANKDGQNALEELDGPRVGLVIVNNDTNQSGNTAADSGLNVKENANSSAEDPSGSFNVKVTLSDPDSAANAAYTGFEGNKLMSQDTEVTIKLEMNATGGNPAEFTYPGDFSLDLSNFTDLGLTPVVEYVPGAWENGIEGGTWINGYVTVTFTLPKGFDLDSAADLNFNVTVHEDAQTESGQSLKISVVTDGMNESTADEGVVTVTLTDGELSGPVFSIGMSDVAESARPDAPDAVSDNLTHIAVNISGRDDKNIQADESVTFKLTVGGQSGCVFNPAAPADGNALIAGQDAYWASLNDWNLTFGEGASAVVKSVTGVSGPVDGVYTVTFEGGYVVQCKFGTDTTGKGVVEVTMSGETLESLGNGATLNVGVGITDDLRETSEGNETLDVSFDFVYKTGEGAPGAEAEFDGSKNGTITIIQDARTDTINQDTRPDELNPYTFDGPFVSIAATDTGKEYAESDKGDINFKISLLNPNGDGGLFNDTDSNGLTEEAVTVTLQFNSDASLTLSDLVKPDATGKCTVTVTIYDAGGASLGTVTIEGNAWDSLNEMTFDVTLPAGVSEITFSLPVNDDPLGASDSSALDKPEEAFTLEIVGVEGNEARALDGANTGSTESETVIITDDGSGDTLEGITVGLAWNTTLAGTNLLAEGANYNLGIKLYAGNTALTSSNNGTSNPYVSASSGKYTQNAVLPENMTVTLNLTNTNGQDVNFNLGGLKTLLTSGDITITIGGVEYKTLAAYQAAHGLNLPGGEVTITIIAANFSAADLGNLYVQVQVQADNVNEYEKEASYEYADNATASTADALGPEGIKVEITDVNGNESAIKEGKESVWSDITDRANGELAWSEDSGEYVIGGWQFGIKVSYGNDENNNWGTADKNDPGEAVHLQLNIANTDAMQNGQEFVVDAYSLFLSMNKDNSKLADFLTDNNITDLDSYLAWLDSLDGNTDGTVNSGYGDLLAACESAGVILVYGTEAQWDDGSAVYDVYVPKSEFADGQIDFVIDQGSNAGAQGGFEISIVDPYNGQGSNTDPNFDMKGEITKVDSTPLTTEEPGEKIVLSLSGTERINEDPNMGGADSNIATYKVGFAMSDKDGNPIASSPAAGDISFTLTFAPKSGVSFDSNLADNAYLDNWVGGQGVGDVGLQVASADYDGVYTCINPTEAMKSGSEPDTSLQTMLQAWFDEKYGSDDMPSPIEVRNVSLVGGKLVMDLTVKEGFDLSEGVELEFLALDDSLTDNPEKFDVTLTNVGSNTGDEQDTLNVAISRDRRDETTIQDETSNSSYKSELNGFAIALEDSSGWEANLVYNTDGGAKNMVYATVRAYALGDESNGPISMATLEGYFANYQDNGGELGFTKFALTFFAPQQPITVNYSLQDGSAEVGTDYMSSGSHQISTGAWSGPYVDGNGNVYFVAAGKDGLPIETIRDFLSEGDQDFNITLNGSSGNESRPYASGDNVTDTGNGYQGEDVTPDANVVIKDVYDGPSVIKFGPSGQRIVEPVDANHADGDNSVVNVLDYRVELSEAAREDVAVWLNTGLEGNAAYGEDYHFGEGMYAITADGEIVKYNHDGTTTVLYDGSGDPAAALAALYGRSPVQQNILDAFTEKLASGEETHFVIIKEGSTQVEFEVVIHDDNDTINGLDWSDPNADVTGNEYLGMEIGGIVGSEVAWQDADGNYIPFDTAVDFPYKLTGGEHDGMIVSANQDAQTYTWQDERGLTVSVNMQEQTVTYYNDKGALVTVSLAGSDYEWINDYPVPTFAVDSNDSNYLTRQEIADDGWGPTVSFGLGGRLDWNGELASVPFNVKMPDVCQEDVVVTIRLFGEDIYGGADGGLNTSCTITIAIPAGQTGLGDNFTLADIKDALTNSAHPLYDKISVEGNLPGERESFYMQISGSQGGESHSDNSYIYVDYDSGTSMVLTDLRSTGIEERTPDGDAVPPVTPDYPAYSFEIGNINDTTLADVRFDIVFRPDSAGEADMNGDGTFSADGKITISIPQDFLDDYSSTTGGSGKVQLKVEADSNGNPVVYYDNNGVWEPVPGASVTGDLPSACNDTRIEGTEDFIAIVNNPSGIDNDTAPVATPIEDKTLAKLQYTYTDAEGNPITDLSALPEGTVVNVTASLVLCDESGNLITDGEGKPIPVTADGPLDFDVVYQNGSAALGEDYGGDRHFYIEAGQSSGSFQFTVYEDHISEGTDGKETFEFGVSMAEGAPSVYEHLYEHLVGVADDAASVSEWQEVTIADNDSGPIIDFSVNGSVSEAAGSVTVTYGSYTRTEPGATSRLSVREVVQEEVTLTFTIAPKDGTTVLWEDLDGITIGNQTYTFQPDGSVEPNDGTVVKDGDNYIVTVTMPKGSALGSFQINPHQDTITESGEGFTVTLTGTQGGETDPVNGGRTSNVNITDDNNGYHYSLSPLHGEEADYAGAAITFNNGQAPDEVVTVTLSIGADGNELMTDPADILISIPGATVENWNYDANTNIFTYTVSGQTLTGSYDPTTGQLVFELPKGMSSGRVEVQFPMKDNSVVGNDHFQVILENVTGGEMNGPGGVSYSSTFAGEQGAVGGANSYTTFEVGTGNSLNGVLGEVKFTVGNDYHDVIESVTITMTDDNYNPIPGTEKTYTSAELNDMIMSLGGNYIVKINYVAATPENADDLAKAKADISVNASLTGSKTGVTVTVTDESDPDRLDGPVAGLTMGGDVTEGGTLAGTVHLDMGTLSGDADTVQEDLTITLQYGGDKNPDGSWNEIALIGMDAHYTLQGPDANGLITITVKEGALIPSGGVIEISYEITVPDNALTDNPEFTLSVTGIEGAEGGVDYESYKVDQDNSGQTVTVTDDGTADALTVALTVPDSVTEGAATGGFNLTITQPNGVSQSTVLDQDLTITLNLGVAGAKITGLPTGWTASGASDDNGYLTITIKAGTAFVNGVITDSNGFSVTIPDNALMINPNLTMGISAVNDNGVYESVLPNVTTNNVTVKNETTKDGFRLNVSGEQAADGNAMAFTIALAALGNFFNSGSAIASEISFDLNLEGFTADQITAIIGSLDDITDVKAEPGTDPATIAVTLAPDYVYNPNNPLTFTVDAADGGDQVYKVSIAPDSVTSYLEVTEVGTDATVTVNLTIESGDSGETIYGGYGNDILNGGAGDDFIYGGAGNDTIYGGAGSDIMTGGGGKDTFIWNDGDYTDGAIDQILDFSFGDGDSLIFNGLSDLLANISGSVGDGKLTLTVSAETITQSVEINFNAGEAFTLNISGGEASFDNFAQFATAYSSAEADDQTAMMNAMLQTILNNG